MDTIHLKNYMTIVTLCGLHYVVPLNQSPLGVANNILMGQVTLDGFYWDYTTNQRTK